MKTKPKEQAIDKAFFNGLQLENKKELQNFFEALEEIGVGNFMLKISENGTQKAVIENTRPSKKGVTFFRKEHKPAESSSICEESVKSTAVETIVAFFEIVKESLIAIKSNPHEKEMIYIWKSELNNYVLNQ